MGAAADRHSVEVHRVSLAEQAGELVCEAAQTAVNAGMGGTRLPPRPMRGRLASRPLHFDLSGCRPPRQGSSSLREFIRMGLSESITWHGFSAGAEVAHLTKKRSS